MKVPSLSLRLALFVGILGLLQGAVVLLFSYATFQRELDAQKRAVLRDKEQHAVRLLNEMPDVEAIRSSATQLVELLAGHADLHVAVGASDSKVPYVAFSDEAVESLSRLRSDTWGTDAFLDWKAKDSGVRMLSHAAEGHVKNGQPYELVLSASRADDDRLLGSLLVTSATAAPVGLAFVFLSAVAIVRLGLRPLGRLRNAAAAITANNLTTRIDPRGVPSELQALCLAFNSMLERLDEGVRRLSEFSGDLAHEMRTPLATLLGRTQVAMSQPRTHDELLAVLEHNVEEVQRLSRLVSDMLFLAQADHAQAALEPVELDLALEAQKVAEYLQILADERGVGIVVEGSATVRADRQLVQRAITNLVSNAIRHCSPDTQIRVRASRSDSTAELEVTNRGSTIDPTHHARLFDRFYRIDSARTRDLGGTGLGLAIVSTIMKLHRGDVGVRSDPQGNTSFTLRFPAPALPTV